MNGSSSTPQYDEFAAGYKRTKEAPLRRHVEAYTFMQLMGDVQGLHVLDLACGDGFYSRRLHQAGAASVTGVDVSSEMIALAKAEEQRAPLGIDYRCGDAATLQLDQRYDAVSAAYLLHYAPDVGTLQKMCANIGQWLRPGGRFVAINENPDQPAATDPAYTQYGFNKQFSEPRSDGSRIDYMMVSGRQMIRFNVWYYARESYEQALSGAGFTDIMWCPLQLSAAGVEECGTEYWQAYLDNPPVIGLQARRK